MKYSKIIFIGMLILLSISSACTAAQPTAPAPAATQLITDAQSPTDAPVSSEPTLVSTEPATAKPELAIETAAASVEPAAAAFTVTDALGREVAFQSPPQRIAVAGKANTLVADALYLFPEALERLIVLGKGTQGTGNFLEVVDPAYAEKTKLENDTGPEQLAAEKPDLVILKSYLAETLGAPLEQIGIPVIYVDFETPEQYTRDLQNLGLIFQNEARAQELTGFYGSTVEAIASKVSGLTDEQKPKVLLLYYSDKDGEVAFNVPPMGWIQTMMVETAGGNPVWKDANLGKGWTKVTLEQIAAWDADQVYIISYFKPVDEVIAGIKADPQWQELRAFKEGQLFGFASDMLSWDQADSRWILGQMWLATKIQPELFTDVDILAEAKSFFTKYYGLSEAAYNEKIVPLLAGALP